MSVTDQRFQAADIACGIVVKIAVVDPLTELLPAPQAMASRKITGPER